MPSLYDARLLMLIPAARQGAITTWWDANIDPGQGARTWGVALSATGSPPATHYWCSTALTAPQLKLVMQRLCIMAGIAAPAAWDTWSRAVQRQWLLDQRAAIRTATGIWIVPDANEAVWSDPGAALALLGLQQITPTL